MRAKHCWILLPFLGVMALISINSEQKLFADRKFYATGDKSTSRALFKVYCGIDVLEKEKFETLKGAKVGLVTNHTGRNRIGLMTIDLLHQAKTCELVALYSPEHGIRGELDQENIEDGIDKKTGIKVWSLYGKRRKPDTESLKGVDTLVYDIQDIGCRFYTYISTMGMILEAAAENNIKVIILDRPNPIGGLAVDGPLTDVGKESFIAYHSLPIRHGMTVGELAEMFVKERKLNVQLQIVAMEGWSRGEWYDETSLPWVNPSPNMRTLTAALLYPGIGLLETTNISVGRGTERPFEWIGAPWMNGQAVALKLRESKLPGLRFVPTTITPNSSVYANQSCNGIAIHVDDWRAFDTLRTGLTIARVLQQLYPKDWSTKNFNRLLVHQKTYEAFLEVEPIDKIQESWREDLLQFMKRRKEFLIYPE